MFDWVIAMIRMKMFFRKNRFSKRRMFLTEVQPITENGYLILWPDALFYITNKDVTRAIQKIGKPTERNEP